MPWIRKLKDERSYSFAVAKGRGRSRKLLKINLMLNLFQKTQIKISENKERSMLYKFGKWIYGLIENAAN